MRITIADAALGWLARKCDRLARAATARRCTWFGHSYRWLTGGTWNCHKCGRLKLLRPDGYELDC